MIASELQELQSASCWNLVLWWKLGAVANVRRCLRRGNAPYPKIRSEDLSAPLAGRHLGTSKAWQPRPNNVTGASTTCAGWHGLYRQ
jgi:hypothetical protein